MIIRHYLISGKVQGVGYRQFVLKQALAIGLKGQVRNLSDGRVEIIAFGSDAKIRPFEAMLAKGPKNSSIEGIKRVELGADQEGDKSKISSQLESAVSTSVASMNVQILIQDEFHIAMNSAGQWNL